jgi:hypothetical protein
MENSNYAEALTLLKQDKARLVSQLEVVEVAINALTKLNGGNVYDSSTAIVSTNSTNGSTVKKPRKNYLEDVEININNVYSNKFSLVEQVVYALYDIKSGTIEDITDCIVQVDNGANYDKLFPRFREIASGLYRAGKITADTTRKKYRYSLKNDDIINFELPF